VPERYDEIGATYTATRRADPRLAARFRAAIGDARTVLNVGAGSGAYEPEDLDVTAVEPSAVMRAQRTRPAIDARAEELPFTDASFDVTMAILSDHHWTDRARGLAELRRVARRRAVVFTWDPAAWRDTWLVPEYLPGLRNLTSMSLEDIGAAMGATRIERVPIPHDCTDGFLHAYWRRPEAYLDPVVRANISVFALLPAHEVETFTDRLREDLATGEWRRRHAALLDREELDCGYRLLIADRV
jgi:SAM-dependent methyltransferase